MSIALAELVQRWQLQAHPEGGWYREVQRSSIQVTRPDGKQRSAITTVLFLLSAEDVSRWHGMHGGDEIWTFISGAPPSLFQYFEGAVESTEQVLSTANPVGWASASELLYGPGFSFEDFELLGDRGGSEWPDGIDDRLI